MRAEGVPETPGLSIRRRRTNAPHLLSNFCVINFNLFNIFTKIFRVLKKYK